MKLIFNCLLAVFLFHNSFAWGGSPVFPKSGHESIEWCDIWISHADETNLPRVLLIGDSIARDYYPNVEKHLAVNAYVARLATSRFIGDPVLLQELALVLDNTKFQVIHFNNGMHGWGHSEEEYQKAFPTFLAAIRQHAPQAKLIWASTTTLKNSNPANPVNGSNERIAARNAIALKYVTKQCIAVDDLNTLVRSHPEYHSDNVHFNGQGVQLEAEQVADAIKKVMSP